MTRSQKIKALEEILKIQNELIKKLEELNAILDKKNLYDYVNQIDISLFKLETKYKKIEIHPVVRKYKKQLGCIFHEILCSFILPCLTKAKSVDQADISLETSLWRNKNNFIPSKIYFPAVVESCLKSSVGDKIIMRGQLFHPRDNDFRKWYKIIKRISCDSKYDKTFDLNTFIATYDFTNYNFQEQHGCHYGTAWADNFSENEKQLCQKYLNDLLLKSSISQKLKAQKLLMSDIGLLIDGFGAQTIDLIVDDMLIDVKTDAEIKKIPNDYIAQLLRYYIFVKYAIISAKENNSDDFLKKLTINKICLYYAHFDLLLEFDVKKYSLMKRNFLN
jgi:hypothetical protein